MKTINRIFVIGLMFLIISCGWNLDEIRLVNEYAKFNMLIASDSSDFKDSIRDKLIFKYRDKADVNVINVKNLKKIQPEQYDIIVVIDTCLVWNNLNLSSKDFFNALKNKDKAIMLMTTGDTDWKHPYEEIDVVTSASDVRNEKKVFDRLCAEIEERFKLAAVEKEQV